MEWINKIPNWIKIPLKILLPSLTIFSGFLLLASEELLIKLYLFDFRKENGFAFGLIFLICISLILCYSFSFLLNFIIKKIDSYRLKKAQFRTYTNLAECYREVLIEMYRRPSRSMKMEISNAVTTYLINIHAVGTSQVSSIGLCFDCFLQPWVVHAIEKTIDMKRKLISTNKGLLNKEKNNDKISELKQEISKAEKYIKYITSESTETDFDWDY